MDHWSECMKLKSTIEQLRNQAMEIRYINSTPSGCSSQIYTPEEIADEHKRIFDAIAHHEKLYIGKGCDNYDTPRRKYYDDE